MECIRKDWVFHVYCLSQRTQVGLWVRLTSKQWKHWISFAPITLKTIGIQYQNFSGGVGRYRSSLIKICSIMCQVYPRLKCEGVLRCAVMGNIDTMSSKELILPPPVTVVPTLTANQTSPSGRKDKLAVIATVQSKTNTISAKLRIHKAPLCKPPLRQTILWTQMIWSMYWETMTKSGMVYTKCHLRLN